MSKKKDSDPPVALRDAYLDLLGMTCRDRVSGFAGVVSSVCFDLYGCVQVILCPPVDKDGKIPESRFFDVNRIEIQHHKARCMPVPPFQPLPQDHNKGPAEKPRHPAT